jgi:hypothetical protein
MKAGVLTLPHRRSVLCTSSGIGQGSSLSSLKILVVEIEGLSHTVRLQEFRDFKNLSTFSVSSHKNCGTGHFLTDRFRSRLYNMCKFLYQESPNLSCPMQRVLELAEVGCAAHLGAGLECLVQWEPESAKAG